VTQLHACYNFAVKVSELGEFGLIDLLSKVVNRSPEASASRPQLIIGIGDDAAVWQGDASIQLATTDSLIQDIHFSLATASWEELGWKALAVNLSDIAAMGGVPRYALVSLALPSDTEVEDVIALYRGMVVMANEFGVALVGGDTCSAPLVAITITVLGSAKNREGHILARSSAKPGEKIAVTGYLGAAAAGLEMLSGKLQLDPEDASRLRTAFLRPRPRIAEGQQLVAQGVKAAIDISDGLISDLKHICEQSRVGARIEVDHVPVAPVVKANFDDKSLELALTGGEDYELLFTASAHTIEKVKAAVACQITVVGEITADETERITLVDREGNSVHLKKAGWEHFATE